MDSVNNITFPLLQLPDDDDFEFPDLPEIYGKQLKIGATCYWDSDCESLCCN